MPPGTLPILTYHAIDTSGSVLSTPPRWFAQTLRALLDSGFQPIDLSSWIEAGSPTSPRAFAVTFDDGLASCLPAADLLASLGVPATFFLVSDFMGRTNAWPGQPPGIPRLPVMTWRQARDLLSAGFQLGAHTRTHPDLRRLDDASLLDELRSCRDALASALGQPCRLFAYPYGRSSPRIRSAARRLFQAALGTRLDLARPFDDPFHLPRLDAYYLRDRASLHALLSGRWHAHSRLRRWLRSVRQIPQNLSAR